MPETLIFRCPCCGQLAPIARLEEDAPFPLEKYLHIFGGKDKISEDEREARKGGGYRRGSGPGRMRYEQLEVDDELRELCNKRIEAISEGGQV